MNNYKVLVVIPTRNRKELVLQLLAMIDKQSFKVNKVLVIDSSDTEIQELKKSDFTTNIEYHYVKIQSAAVQRNIGMDLCDTDTQVVFFLDDDVIPQADYFERIIKILDLPNVTGASGIAVTDASTKKKKFVSFTFLFKWLFNLDSRKEGIITSSGVNIPVQTSGSRLTKAEWLIGCAGWNFQKVSGIRFEKDFLGQSLAEDVIFSSEASKTGVLMVDNSIILKHLESNIGRPNLYDFWKMWITNRYRLITKIKGKNNLHIAFWWANLGQLLILLLKLLMRKDNSLSAISGLFAGSKQIIRYKNEN